MCPWCDHEVMLQAIYKIQQCPNCKRPIIPCSLCDMDKVDCTKCELELKLKGLWQTPALPITQ